VISRETDMRGVFTGYLVVIGGGLLCMFVIAAMQR
jgi:hypothetical protein